jgi:ClpP class serine protease
MGILDLFWIFFISSMITPWLQQKILEANRVRILQKLEKKRGSRVITLIHRQETMSLLGFPVIRYIDINDSEDVLRAIRLTPDHMPIDLILHTPGGLVLASEQIAHALCRHKGKVTVMIPHYAMSGGTLIALAADEILMDENAVLGPLDPQLGEYPAASLLTVIEQKPIPELEDKTLILADVAKKAMRQVRRTVKEILVSNHMEEKKAEELANLLTEGRWTHDYPISCEEAQELGLPVKRDLPEEIYLLMSLYPQPAQRRPSVQYIPIPYQEKEKKK